MLLIIKTIKTRDGEFNVVRDGTLLELNFDNGNIGYSQIDTSSEKFYLPVYKVPQYVFATFRKALGLSRCAVLGAGGCTVPRFIVSLFEDTECDAVEYSSEIYLICKDYFLEGLDLERLNLVNDDAYKFIKENKGYDFVYVDLYVNTSIQDIKSEEFLSDLIDSMTLSGVCVSNTFNNNLGSETSNKEASLLMAKKYKEFFLRVFLMRDPLSRDRNDEESIWFIVSFMRNDKSIDKMIKKLEEKFKTSIEEVDECKLSPIVNDTVMRYFRDKHLSEEYEQIISARTYSCLPKTKQQLRQIIIERILRDGVFCDLNDIDVSKIKDMSHLFDSYYKKYPVLQYFEGDISMWDVSNVTDMSYMFCGCENFDGDLSLWDVSNVTTMYHMFCRCLRFNSDLSLWNVSNVTDMGSMFNGCENFDSDLSNWDVSNVRDMSYMFCFCKRFNQDISNWNVSNVRYMNGMFLHCSDFNLDLSGWDLSSVVNMKNMFKESWERRTHCPIRDEYKPVKKNLNEEFIPRKKRTSISRIDPYSCHPKTKEELKEIIIERINEEGPICSLNDIDVSGITDMSYLFNADNKWMHDKNNVYGNKIFKEFNGDISRWDVSNVTDMSCMFYKCISFNGNISNWDVSNVTNMNGMFNSCKSFDRDISLWDVSNVTDMSYMFERCKIFNQDLSNWDVSNVTDMFSMFDSCKSLKCDLSRWNVSNVKSMGMMFDNCPKILKPDWYIKRSLNEEYVPKKKRTSISKIDMYSCHPKSKEELREIIIERINEEGPTCDLNDIDVSYISDMSHLFDAEPEIDSFTHNYKPENRNKIFTDFNGNISKWNVSNVTNMSFMFYSCFSFNSDISKWNVSNVDNMLGMFHSCCIFDLDLSEWDVSNVTNMSEMFNYCKEFDLDLSEWDVSNVTNMSKMFNCCYNFNRDISKWDVSKVRDMSYMFSGCGKFNSNISLWNVSRVTNMIQMFYYCEKFNSDISLWDVSRVTKMSYMFCGCKDFNRDISNWNVSRVRDMNCMFSYCNSFKYDLSRWNISKAKYANTVREHMKNINEEYVPRLRRTSISKIDPYSCHPTTKEELREIIIQRLKNEGRKKIYDCDLNDIDVSNITDMSSLFLVSYDNKIFKKFNCDISKWNVSNVVDMSSMFYGCYVFNQDISKWNVSSVTDMHSMFGECSNFNLDLSNWDVSSVTNMSYMFHFCKNFNSDISLWNVSRVSNMNCMFGDCIRFDQDLSRWNVSNVINMQNMFSDCKRLNSDLSNWDVSSVTDMGFMFEGCLKFNSDISLWDVSNVTNMVRMFNGCKRFNSDLSLWNVSNVTNMYFMFNGCKRFNSNLSLWNVSNVTNMAYMFDDCDKFNCDLSSWDISKAIGTKSIRKYMKHINEEYVPRQRRTSISKINLYTCHPRSKEELQDIIIERIEKEGDTCNLNDIDVSNIIDMSYLFCIYINRIFENFNGDISKWDVSNVIDMSNMFHGCKKFDGDLFNWDVSNVTDMSNMFFSCESFNSNISLWDVSNVTNMKDMFCGCISFNRDLSSWDVSKANGTEIFVRQYMRHINEEYIPRQRRTSITKLSPYTYYPETKKELHEIIIERIENEGPTCSLNDIDVSRITDMSYLFDASGNSIFKHFNGDISLWDVSNVTDMRFMFSGCEDFNCDISNWKVPNVKNISYMFFGCESFDLDLSSWNIPKDIEMTAAFLHSGLLGKVEKYPYKVDDSTYDLLKLYR